MSKGNGEEYNNYPPAMIASDMEKQIQRGAECYMKWTCGRCGQRVTSIVPNRVFLFAMHDDCGFVTDIEQAGCNFLAILSLGTSGYKRDL
jgi:hypothetical protein